MVTPTHTEGDLTESRDALARLRSEKGVIEQAYAATTNPEHLEDFETYWEAYIDMLLQQHDGRSDLLSDAPVNSHIARAVSIIDQLGSVGARENRAQTLVDATPGPALLIDHRLRILSANADADEWLALLSTQTSNMNGAGQSILILDTAGQARLEAFLAKIQAPSAKEERQLIFLDAVIGDGANDGPQCLLGTTVMIRSRDDSEQGTYVLLTRIDLDLDPSAREPYAEAYNLTPSEIEIAIDLAKGLNAREIAKARNVRKATLDKQIKQIRAKTETRSIAELVRKFSLMIAKSHTVQAQLSRVSDMPDGHDALIRRRMITARDGRQISVVEQGHPRGRAVINLHTVMGTGILPERAARAAVLRGLRIITPWRAGFERSDPVAYRDIAHMLDSSADDIADVLDVLGIDDAVIIGGRIGQHFLVRYSDRARALIMINLLTHWKNDHLAYFQGRRRSMLKTSLFAPSAVRYLVRVAQMLIRSGRPDIFLKQLNKFSALDLQTLNDAQTYAVIEEGTYGMAAQSADPYAWDVRLIHTDMSAQFAQVAQPMAIIHGTQCVHFQNMIENDPSTRTLMDRIDISVSIPNAGNYLLLTHSDEVFDLIDRIAPQT